MLTWNNFHPVRLDFPALIIDATDCPDTNPIPGAPPTNDMSMKIEMDENL